MELPVRATLAATLTSCHHADGRGVREPSNDTGCTDLAAMKSKRVLVVDDDAIAVRRISPTFENAGYEVVTAASRQQLRWSLLEGVPEIVLMNGSASRVDILKLTRDVRRHPGGSEVLIVAFGTRSRAREDVLAKENVQLVGLGPAERDSVVEVVMALLKSSSNAADIPIAEATFEVPPRHEHLTPVAPSSRSPVSFFDHDQTAQPHPAEVTSNNPASVETQSPDFDSVWDDESFKERLREKDDNEQRTWDETPLSAGVVAVAVVPSEPPAVADQAAPASSSTFAPEQEPRHARDSSDDGSLSSSPNTPKPLLDTAPSVQEIRPRRAVQKKKGGAVPTPMPGSTRIAQYRDATTTPARAGGVRMPSSRRRPASLQPPAMRREVADAAPGSGPVDSSPDSVEKEVATSLRQQMRYLTQCSDHEALGVPRDASREHVEAAFALLIEEFEAPPYSSTERATVSMLVRRIVDHLTRGYRRLLQKAASDPDGTVPAALVEPLWKRMTADSSVVSSSGKIASSPAQSSRTPAPGSIASRDSQQPSSRMSSPPVQSRRTPSSQRVSSSPSHRGGGQATPSSRRSPKPNSSQVGHRTPSPDSPNKSFRRSSNSIRRSRVPVRNRSNIHSPISSTPAPVEVENNSSAAAGFFARGMEALESGHLRDARNLFHQAHRLDPNDQTQAFVDVAKALTMRNEDREEALSLLKRAYKASRHELIKQLVVELQSNSSKQSRSAFGGIFRSKK